MDIAREICPAFELTEANKRVLALIFDWALCRPGKLDPAKGLWIWGPMGTGKSTLLRVIREFCYEVRLPTAYGTGTAELPYWFSIVPATGISDDYATEGPKSFAHFVNNPKLAIDDLGTEQKIVAHYGVAAMPMTEVLQRRYDQRGHNFTHVTTNLRPDEILERYGLRVVERIPEMFNLIELKDYSHRPNLKSY